MKIDIMPLYKKLKVDNDVKLDMTKTYKICHFLKTYSRKIASKFGENDFDKYYILVDNIMRSEDWEDFLFNYNVLWDWAKQRKIKMSRIGGMYEKMVINLEKKL